MFGKAVRAAAAFAAGMLVASVINMFLGSHFLPRLADSLGTDSLLYESLAAVNKWFVLIVLLAAIFGLIARGVTESQVRGT